MDNLDLPSIPPDLGFEFKNHTIENLKDLWGCSRRTMTDRLRKIRDLLGARVGQDYSADQVIIMCLLWEPPEAYYSAYRWMEVHGWKDFIAKKYRLEKYLDPKMRSKLIEERYSKKKHTKK
jgi:hypothetical protein